MRGAERRRGRQLIRVLLLLGRRLWDVSCLQPRPLVGRSTVRAAGSRTTLASSVQHLRPVRVEHVQGEESDDEVALSGQHGNTTTEEGGVRALDATLGVAGVEQTSVQTVQRGQASVSGGEVVLDRPVRSPKGGSWPMPGPVAMTICLFYPAATTSCITIAAPSTIDSTGLRTHSQLDRCRHGKKAGQWLVAIKTQ